MKNITLYNNRNIILRFQKYYNISYNECIDIFEETKKWLWLCTIIKKKQTSPLVLIESMLIIDEMWHNFICFTEDYKSFCEDYLEDFIHHKPIIDEKNDYNKITIEKENLELKNLIGVVMDNLGIETVEKWFGLYPIKYSRANMKLLFKQWD